MNKQEIELGGITSNDGAIVAAGQQGIATYALLMWRTALGLEIKTGMMAGRNVNAKTIIPQLVALEITDVALTRLTRPRKIKAYEDLNAFLVSKGFMDRPL
jgi:hypothetical protein